MRLSFNWLKEYINLDISPEQLADKMTMIGMTIDAIERPGAEITNVFVGQILSIEPHPDADKLVVCKTDVGQAEPLQIVCGAKNMKVGDKVPTAVLGATLPGGFAIGKRKMRGIESQGMMCSARELGLGEDHSGLMILDPQASIGADAVKLLGLDDAILEVDITPNRGDWAGMIGVARELFALFHVKHMRPDVVPVETETPIQKLSSVTVRNETLCPRYLGRVMTHAKIKASPLWLCQRLIAAGLRPINNVVDITNYVLLETGHPLHAFDLSKLAGKRIEVRLAKDGESLETIDGQIRTLSSDMLVIADAERPVAVAGVMGGRESEVGEHTTEIFLESAYFDPKSIRKTARTLGMQTEASSRFQRGADIEMAEYALDRAAALMQELAGAELAAGKLDCRASRPTPQAVSLRYARTNELLGTLVSQEDQKSIIERLGFNVIKTEQSCCSVTPPSWRHDVTQEADLIEEIARLHGYNQIPTTLPRIARTDTVIAPQEQRIRSLRRFLVDQGLTQVINMTFSNPDAVSKAGLPASYQNMVRLQNPLSENQSMLRSSLIPGLLETGSLNFRHGRTRIAAFEVGPVFLPQPGKDQPIQSNRLTILLAGPSGPKHWAAQAAPFDFYDLKGYLDQIAGYLGLTLSYSHTDFGPCQSGYTAQLSLTADETPVGTLGMARKDILAAYDIEQVSYLAELDLDALLTAAAPTPQFSPIETFPPSLRDLAVVVDAALPAGNLVQAAREVGGELLKQVDLLDVYTGKQVAQGKKSVALGLVFQSSERTLTDKDTDKMVTRILARLEESCQAVLR